MTADVLVSNHNPAVWGLRGTLIWGLIIAVAFVVTQVVVMGLYIGIHYKDASSLEYKSLMLGLQYNGTVVSLVTLASLLVCGPLIWGIVKLKKNSNLKHYLGLKWVGVRTLAFWLVVIICLLVASDLLTGLLGKSIVPDFMETAYKSAESRWLLWLALVIAAPVFEELYFRGFLISGFSSTFVGPIGAVVITAALWAVIHVQYDLYGVLTIFIMGLLLGVARLRTGSVLLTIAIHSFANLVATIETAIYLS